MKKVVVALTLAMTTSCLWKNTVFHHYEEAGDGWTAQDTLFFQTPMLDAGETYRLSVDIRHSDTYPYRNLGLVIEHNLKDTKRLTADTLVCTLYNQSGTPLGEGVASIYQLSLPYSTFRTDSAREAIVRLHHCMQDVALDGILDLGVKIERKK